MGCDRCYMKTKIQSHSGGEVDVCRGCALVPDMSTMVEVLRKPGCYLGDSIREAINFIETKGNSVNSIVPYRVTFNTKLYRIEQKGNSEWLAMRGKDYPKEVVVEYPTPEAVVHFENQECAKKVFDELVKLYKYNKVKDYWRPVSF